MMKTTLFRIVAIAGFIAIAIVVRSRRSWRSKSKWLASQLMQQQQQQQNQQHDISLTTIAMIEDDPSFQDLPYVVKRYLRKALQLGSDDTTTTTKQVPWIQSVQFQQHGTFRIHGIWVPFVATQYISAMDPIGFLWDSTVLMVSPWGLDMPVSVRDAFMNGKGSLEASLGHMLTLANLHDNPQIDLGEEQRWLAEAVLIPSALLPSKQIHGVLSADTKRKRNS